MDGHESVYLINSIIILILLNKKKIIIYYLSKMKTVFNIIL